MATKYKQMKDGKVYRIRNKETGLYSSGGCVRRFDPVGKFYQSLSTIKSHLSMLKEYDSKKGSIRGINY